MIAMKQLPWNNFKIKAFGKDEEKEVSEVADKALSNLEGAFSNSCNFDFAPSGMAKSYGFRGTPMPDGIRPASFSVCNVSEEVISALVNDCYHSTAASSVPFERAYEKGLAENRIMRSARKMSDGLSANKFDDDIPDLE